MQPAEMLALLRKRPFEPFRVHLDDGRVFGIRYPQMNLVTEMTFIIGVPDPNHPDPTIADRFARAAWPQITKMERLTAAATS